MKTQQKTKKYAVAIGRIIVLYLVFVVVSLMSWVFLKTSHLVKYIEGFWDDTLYAQVSFGYCLIIFFSLSSVFQLHNPALKNQYFSNNNGKRSLLQNCALIMRSRLFWIETSALSVCLLLFSGLPPLSFFYTGFLDGGSPLRQILLNSGVLLLVVLLYFLASISTLSWWGETGKKRFHENIPLVGLLIQLSYTIALWILGGSLLAIVYPMLSSIFKVFYMYWMESFHLRLL